MARKSTKKTTKRKSRRNKKTTASAAKIHIRMYRLGVGDCFLVTIPRSGLAPYRMLIDCGVHMAQKGGTDRIKVVARDIIDETGGHIDVVVGTHEHWDHISGFEQAKEQFEGNLKADIAWLAWTEDDDDPLSKKIAIKKKRYQSLAALQAAAGRLALSPDGGGLAGALEGLLGFYGDGGGVKLKKCGDSMLALADSKRRFLKPGQKPIEIEGADARIFVLGPPRDEKLIKKDSPSKKHSEVYEFGRHATMAADLQAALRPGNQPFDDRYSIPLSASKGLSFFNNHYWADQVPVSDEADPAEEASQHWRRVNNTWLEAANVLALNLDSDTNNTSLVLAIELGPKEEGGPVILFAADAQVGNWLGWELASWDYHGRTVTAQDLLSRTIIYKVGHHASHNATLKEKGLELMDNLELALVPTDDEMAKKVKWGTLPWPPLLAALNKQAAKGVVRTDRENGARRGSLKVVKDELYYEAVLMD